MKNKGLIIGILVLLIAIGGYFVLQNGQSQNKENDSTIKIGCSAPLSGNGANYGRSVKEGVLLAVKEINDSDFLGRKLEVIFEDDKMNPKDGVNAINKLINTDKVPIIIGPFGSSIVMATAPIAEKNKTILISASATADDIKYAGDYIFRITPQNSKQGSDIANFCYNSLKTKKAGVIFQNNDYGITLQKSFEDRFASLGGEIVVSEGVDLNITNLKTQIQKMIKDKPDVVFFPLHYKESGLFLKQAKELGLNAYFISADGAMTEDLLKIAGNSAEGSFYSTLALDFNGAKDDISRFNKLFTQEYDKEYDIYNAYYYEVTWLIANAIKEGNTDSETIKQYLYNVQKENCYKGLTGKTCFDEYGEVDKPFFIYIVENGKYTIYNNNK